jgi:hypothetical protein
MLQLAQLAGLVYLEAAVLALPAVERLLADAMPPAQVAALRSGLRLLQDPDDLLLGESLPARSRVLPAGILACRLSLRVDQVSGSSSQELKKIDDVKALN